MHPIEQCLSSTLDLVIGWLRYGETKNGAAVALGGAAIATLSQALMSSETTPVWFVVALVAAIVLFAIATLIALASFLPVLDQDWALKWRADKPDHSDNLIYFEHIRKYTGDNLLREIRDRYFPTIDVAETDLRRLTDIAKQVVAISAITSQKMFLFVRAVRFIVAAVMVLIGAALWWILQLWL